MRTTAVVEHRAHTVVDSPVGPLTLVAVAGTLAGLYLDGQRHRPPAVPSHRPGPEAGAGQVGEAGAGQVGEADAGLLAEAAAQVADYFAGRRTAFDVPLTLAGTPFQRAVWAALLTIPHGGTVTYGELARRVGRPGAARAVGLANGRNPISIVVPCHRVVGAAGALTGYAGGLDRKRWLLAHEQGHGQGSLPAHEQGHRQGSLPA